MKRKEKIKNEKDILLEVGMSVWMGRVEALACGHADADGCKQKRKEEKTLTGGFRMCGWACGRAGMWACGHVGVQMGVQLCGHADADGCKQKKKKKHLLGCFECVDGRAGVWACRWACRSG